MPAGEDDAIEAMIRTLQDQLRKRYSGKTVLRDAHPKHHGLVKASFTVDCQCPMELRHGLFRRPGRRFDALIRFSNGHPIVKHDLAFDLRGIGIKLSLQGTGRRSLLGDAEHDFVMATGEGFFGRDAVDFVTFPAASEKDWKSVLYFVRGFRLRGGWQLLTALRCPKSCLVVEYFSQTPYRLGPHCVKYQVRPSEPRRAKGDPWVLRFGVRHLFGLIAKLLGLVSERAPRLVPGFDALRTSLERALKKESVTLEFLVQRWPDLSRLPVWAIENATRRWSAPWERVATIEIHQQDDIRDRDKEAERITITPWRVLRQHQPLGSINRARLAIYREMSAFRQRLNQAPVAPPRLSR